MKFDFDTPLQVRPPLQVYRLTNANTVSVEDSDMAANFVCTQYHEDRNDYLLTDQCRLDQFGPNPLTAGNYKVVLPMKSFDGLQQNLL